MDSDDAGGCFGCAVVGGFVLFKVALFVAIVYVAWHFISKYW